MGIAPFKDATRVLGLPLGGSLVDSPACRGSELCQLAIRRTVLAKPGGVPVPSFLIK